MKTYLLGCGAQKSGTTWLHDNLNRSPEYWSGGIKEWRFWPHYFDPQGRAQRLRELRKQLDPRPGSGRPRKRSKLRRRESALSAPDTFLQNLCAEFLAKEGVSVMGDMTPRNGTLAVEEFTVIREHFEKRDIAVRPLLIMRDPFKRIWSAVRMKLKNEASEQSPITEEKVRKELLDTYRSGLVVKRTRYERIIENLEQVFEPESICYEFTENLFSQQGLDRVTEHLGIASVTVDTSSPNASPSLFDAPDDLKGEIVRYYADTYHAVRDRFGEDVERYWKGSFELLAP